MLVVKLEIWLTCGEDQILFTSLKDIYPDFMWELGFIPLIGDTIKINEDLFKESSRLGLGWIYGKVVKRDFFAGGNTVELSVEVERSRAIQIREALTRKRQWQPISNPQVRFKL